MLIRVMLDVNVWVANFLALSKGRQGSSAQRLVRSILDGHCRLGAIQSVVSIAMLDTLQGVLARQDFPEALAHAARDVVEGASTGGVIGEPPHLVLAGGVAPIKDIEDRGVLEAALAGRADMLVTSNMKDFTPGPRAAIRAEVLRRTKAGEPDVILYRHARLDDGLVITSVPAARSWLLDGMPPPEGVLKR